MLLSNVLSQTGFRDVAGSTVPTDKRPLSRMKTLVDSESHVRGKSLSTNMARLLRGFVYSGNVHLQLCRRPTAFLTDTTRIGVQGLVHSPDMLMERASPVKDRATLITGGVVRAQFVNVLQMVGQGTLAQNFGANITRHLGTDSFLECAFLLHLVPPGMLLEERFDFRRVVAALLGAVEVPVLIGLPGWC